MKTLAKFNLNGRVCIITGGEGLLGKKHAEAIKDAGGIPISLDTQGNPDFKVDITDKKALEEVKEKILERCNRIDVLINNAANNPKVEDAQTNWTRFENFSENIWDDDLNVGLKGAFFCSQVFGTHMAKQGKGVILNIASDLGIIAPDQRIYEGSVKPVTYSVTKHGLIGLGRYLATYWADKGVRVNNVCFGGVFNKQDKNFVERLSKLIPMGRMADQEEYKAAILFLISDASSYMTGSTVVIDGGRTCW